MVIGGAVFEAFSLIDNGVLGLLELFARLFARRALCAPIGGLLQGPKRKLCEGLVALESTMQCCGFG
jgi:hypothetical protein